jgi:hypothetical protein
MQIALWIFGALLLVAQSVIRKRNKQVSRVLFFFAIAVFIGSIFMPRWLLGKWNIVKMLEEKKVNIIVLVPSEPRYDANLTDRPISVLKKDQQGQIINLLKKTELFFPSHPMRSWETKMVFYTIDNDSLVLEVNKTINNGTLIYTKGDVYRKDDLGEYLEKITNFKEPQKVKAE